MPRSPVDHVRVSPRGKEILVQAKRKTGLEHWNELCRIALCRSLANPSRPQPAPKTETAIEIDWRTFAGAHHDEFSALVIDRALVDGVDLKSREAIGEYFRAHLERGIASFQSIRDLLDLIDPTLMEKAVAP